MHDINVPLFVAWPMVRAIKALKGSGSFNPGRPGFVDTVKAPYPDYPDIIEALPGPRPRRLGRIFDSIPVGDAAAGDIEALARLKIQPEAHKAAVRILRECTSPEQVLSFRQFIDNALLLPADVLKSLRPALESALRKYPEEISQPGIMSLMERPEAVRPFLHLKRLMKSQPNHRFSEMLEDAAQLPEIVLDENAYAIRGHLQHYAIEIPDRTRRLLIERHEQLRPYLMLRHRLGLTGEIPPLPELAEKILDGVSESVLPANAEAVMVLLSGCKKEELGDKSLDFLRKYQPDQLRAYLKTKAQTPRKD